MGTRGYKVYRYNRRYFVYYNHCDSYPDCLGVGILHKIPRNASKEKFEQWVRAIKENLDAQYEDMKDPYLTDYVTDFQPLNTVFIEWVYEIDFDNLIFHVNTQPMFRLDNMPPDDIFLKSISYDHFGHTALREDTPVQFRYDWRAPPPPPSPESLAAYSSYQNRSSTSSIHDLLSVPPALSSIERARTVFAELLVTRCMAEYGTARYLRILENVPHHDYIRQHQKKIPPLASSLVNFAVGPPIPSLPPIDHNPSQDFVWIHEDVCLCVTTHLDDEDNLRASIGDLVRHISTAQDGKVSTVYGIACSLFHCAVVRVDKDLEGTSFAHTPALQFLPSLYARKISTPGIEALSRLGCQVSGVEFLTAISNTYDLPRITHGDSEPSVASSILAKVPVEVWTRIGDFITFPADLVNLASISTQALSAAADLARCPWALEFRLVDVIGSVPPIPETTESTKDEDIRDSFYEMGRAKFIAVRGGQRVNVELGQYDRWSDSRHEMSFEVESYPRPRGSDELTQNRLYVKVLDDNDDTAT